VTKPYGFFSFEKHRLRAAVYKGAALYVPPREIHHADTMDTAFADRYGSPEWMAANILRFPAKWARQTGVRDSITVHNRTRGTLRSVRIGTAQDLFFLSDLAAGDELELESTARTRTDINWFNVVVERGSETSPPRESGCFSLSGGRKAEYDFLITLSTNRVEFAERRGSSRPCE